MRTSLHCEPTNTDLERKETSKHLKKKKALTRTQSSTPNKLLYWGELSLPEDPELAYMSIFTMTTVSAGVCGFFLYETCKDSNYHVIHSLLAVSPATTVVKRAQITPR